MFANVEQDYLTDPNNFQALCNYALYTHVVLSDYERARRVYTQALTRMAWRGPDSALLLYSYAIFAFVTQDETMPTILELLARGRQAEGEYHRQRGAHHASKAKRGIRTPGARSVQQGTVRQLYELASIGVFQQAALEVSDGFLCAQSENRSIIPNLLIFGAFQRDTCETWHNFASCRYLIFGDYDGALPLFLRAIARDQNHRILQHNFQHFMLERFHYDESAVAEYLRTYVVASVFPSPRLPGNC